MTMKMAELARVSGVGRSAIHFYRNLGLLPAPVRHGPKLHVYGPRHVRRLRELVALRAEGVSIAMLQRRFARPPRQPRERAPGEKPAPRPRRAQDLSARERVLDLAAREFVARGYEGVRVADLARASGISKATFYGWFASKTDLFVGCLDRLRLVVVGPEVRAAFMRDQPFADEARLRVAALLEHAEAYRMMTNLLAQASASSDRALAARAGAAHHRMITGAQPMFERAMQHGECRDLDPELCAYATWGDVLAISDRLALDDRYTTAAAVEAALDFVFRGIAA
jgi:AcrR family transcriptional regulator